MLEHFSSVECHRFRDARLVNALVNAILPAPGKYHLLFFPVGNTGVVWHNGNWQDILPNRLFCIEAEAGFSVRCGQGPVDCFAVAFESGNSGHAVNDYIIIQQDQRAEFIAMNVELATACLTADENRSRRALRNILEKIGRMTVVNHIAFAIRHVGSTIHVPDHFHSSEYQIEYFAAGTGGIRVGRRWMEFERGSFCFIPPAVPHEISYTQSQDVDNYSIKFQFIEDPRIKSPPRSPFVVDVAEEKQAEVLGLLKKIVGEYTMDLPISPESLNRLILLVHDLQEREGTERGKSLASRVKRIVRTDYAGPLSVSAIAAQMGVSPEHLSRKFHQATGGTLAEYITVCRLRSAQAMLQNTALPIKQIAIECGFRSVHYFSNRFRKHYACTPGEMRRRKLPGNAET
jgi:AraC-like DNA-binding protein/mannose-6-phosphate isomerase-like protein (cupin superfamily)